jgi:hypothetical protein
LNFKEIDTSREIPAPREGRGATTARPDPGITGKTSHQNRISDKGNIDKSEDNRFGYLRCPRSEAELGSDVNRLTVLAMVGQRAQAIAVRRIADTRRHIEIAGQTIAATKIDLVIPCPSGVRGARPVLSFSSTAIRGSMREKPFAAADCEGARRMSAIRHCPASIRAEGSP